MGGEEYHWGHECHPQPRCRREQGQSPPDTRYFQSNTNATAHRRNHHREDQMKRFATKRFCLAASTAAGLWLAGAGLAPATDLALTGQVSSAEEGAMEGVLVSAQKDGSTIRTTVVTDAQGRYAFPAARLEPGAYRISIRAVGYELDGAGT